jgi:hypothetical protein
VSAARAAFSGTEHAEMIEVWAAWALAEADRRDPVASARMLRARTKRHNQVRANISALRRCHYDQAMRA